MGCITAEYHTWAGLCPPLPHSIPPAPQPARLRLWLLLLFLLLLLLLCGCCRLPLLTICIFFLLLRCLVVICLLLPICSSKSIPAVSLKLCSGTHALMLCIDALLYAPGSTSSADASCSSPVRAASMHGFTKAEQPPTGILHRVLLFLLLLSITARCGAAAPPLGDRGGKARGPAWRALVPRIHLRANLCLPRLRGKRIDTNKA